MASMTLFCFDHEIMALQMKKREHKQTTALKMHFTLQIFCPQACTILEIFLNLGILMSKLIFRFQKAERRKEEKQLF